MKRFGLTILFATYYFFMPFVMVNCTSVADEPYALNADASENEDSSNAELARCQQLEFIVADCVDVLQAEEERLLDEEAKVNTAFEELDNFATCQAQEVIAPVEEESDDTEEDTTEDVLDCTQTIATVIEGYQTCGENAQIEEFYYCTDVNAAIESAVSACETGDESITEDFCNSLTIID